MTQEVSKRVAYVANGWLDLSFTERQALAEFLEEYSNAEYERKSRVERQLEQKAYERISLGPMSTSCPCCGK
jgi:hypothetical protein